MLSSIQGLMRNDSSVREAGNCIKVRVQTLESFYTLNIHPSTTGKQLLSQIAEKIDLKETWYFGMRYTDDRGHDKWIFPDNKVLQQDMVEMGSPTFKLCVKFYPEDTKEIIQDITLRLFYLHVNDQILSDLLVCSPEMAIFLASYAAQAMFGDYNETEHPPGTLLKERLIPSRFFRQYHLSDKEWEARIVDLWKNHEGISKNEAMVDYLKQAQELEMFGLSYFEIRNKKGSYLFIGVHTLGINVYERSDQLVPRVGFRWSEIHTISYTDKRFVIKLFDKKSESFIFYAQYKRTNNEILLLCMGNHELYMRRRKPETAEIKQLKQQVQHERNLQAEQLALEKLQKAEEVKHQEHEKERCQLHESMRLKYGDIRHANDQIRHLEQQLAESERTKRELINKEKELEQLNCQLQFEKEWNAEERDRLSDKVEMLEVQIAMPRLRIETPEAESSLVQETFADRRPLVQPSLLQETFADRRPLVQSNLLQETVADRRPLIRSSSNKQHFHDDKNEKATEVLANKMNHQGQTETKKQPEPGKSTIQEKLELMSKGLDELKNTTAMTENDTLHEKNNRKGYSRRSTFNVIQDGNTHRRVKQFENM